MRKGGEGQHYRGKRQRRTRRDGYDAVPQRPGARALPVCPVGSAFLAVSLHSPRACGVEEEVRTMTWRSIHWERKLGDIYLPQQRGTEDRVSVSSELRLKLVKDSVFKVLHVCYFSLKINYWVEKERSLTDSCSLWSGSHVWSLPG